MEASSLRRICEIIPSDVQVRADITWNHFGSVFNKDVATEMNMVKWLAERKKYTVEIY